MSDAVKVGVTEVLDAPSKHKVKEAVEDIAQKVKDASHAVLELASTLYQWKQTPEWDEIVRQLDDQNILKESVLKKLLPIGNNKFLMETNRWDRLPPGYNHLYPLTQIETKKLELLYEKGQIHPGLTVDQANELKKKFALKKVKKPKTASSIKISRVIKFKVSSDISKVEAKIKSAVNDFQNALMKIDGDADFKYE